MLAYDSQRAAFAADVTVQHPERKTAVATDEDWQQLLGLLENPRHAKLGGLELGWFLSAVNYATVWSSSAWVYSLAAGARKLLSRGTGQSVLCHTGMDRYFGLDAGYVFVLARVATYEVCSYLYHFVLSELNGMGLSVAWAAL